MRPTQPFQPEELLLWAGFLRTHSRITRYLSEQLEREHGLTVREFEVLLVLSDPGRDRLRMCDLAERVFLTPSGLSRLVDRMEHRGLVERDADPGDQRASAVTATDAGSRLFRRAASSHRKRVRERFLGRLSPDQRTVLTDIWQRLGE